MDPDTADTTPHQSELQAARVHEDLRDRRLTLAANILVSMSDIDKMRRDKAKRQARSQKIFDDAIRNFWNITVADFKKNKSKSIETTKATETVPSKQPCLRRDCDRRVMPAKQARIKRVLKLVDRIIWKNFFDETNNSFKVHQGCVSAVSIAPKGCVYKFPSGITSTVKCSVTYDDGDSEDMTPAQLRPLLVD